MSTVLLTVLIKRHFGFLAFPICRLYIKSLTAAPLPPVSMLQFPGKPQAAVSNFSFFHLNIETGEGGMPLVLVGVSWVASASLEVLREASQKCVSVA